LNLIYGGIVKTFVAVSIPYRLRQYYYSLIINSKIFLRKRPWPEGGSNPEFAWRDSGEVGKISVRAPSILEKFQP
jgi:hypothetical protein